MNLPSNIYEEYLDWDTQTTTPLTKGKVTIT